MADSGLNDVLHNFFSIMREIVEISPDAGECPSSEKNGAWWMQERAGGAEGVSASQGFIYEKGGKVGKVGKASGAIGGGSGEEPGIELGKEGVQEPGKGWNGGTGEALHKVWRKERSSEGGKEGIGERGKEEGGKGDNEWVKKRGEPEIYASLESMGLPLIDVNLALSLFPEHEGIHLETLPEALQRGFIVRPSQRAQRAEQVRRARWVQRAEQAEQLRGNVLNRNALNSNTLGHNALCRSTLSHRALCRNTLRHKTLNRNALNRNVLPMQEKTGGQTGVHQNDVHRAGVNKAGVNQVVNDQAGVSQAEDKPVEDNQVASAHTIALAFSGGLDSRLLAALLRRMGIQPLLFHIFGPHSIVGESSLALRRACGQGFTVVCLPLNPLALELVRANGERRCYHCKYALFQRIREISGLPVCDGTLASDLLEYRPGLQALREHGVISPLALAGFDKALVGRAARAVGLESPGQMSQSCLLTRFGYGVAISEDLLRGLAVADVVARRYLEPYCKAAQREVPYQSLRLPENGDVVLHVEGMALPLPIQRELCALVRQKAPALPPLRVESVGRVKGFFDRQKNDGARA